MIEASVIVPVHNGEATVAEQLEALVSQLAAPPYEVIVVNDHSSDATANIARTYVRRYPELFRCLKTTTGHGSSAARNVGAAAAGGRRLLFCDADDRVSPTWVRDMDEALCSAALATGALNLFRSTPNGERRTGQRDNLVSWHGACPSASSANLGIDREIFTAIGGFDETLHAAEDVDLCIRAHLAGYDAVSARPTVAYRERAGVAAVAAQQAAYAYWDTMVCLRYSDFLRDAGVTPPSLRSTILALAAQLAHFDRLPKSTDSVEWTFWWVQLRNKWNRIRAIVTYTISHAVTRHHRRETA